jgi:hypothetical protein
LIWLVSRQRVADREQGCVTLEDQTIRQCHFGGIALQQKTIHGLKTGSLLTDP